MENEEIKQNSIELKIPENEITEMISINAICRLCANQNDKLIGIYSEEGISNDLGNKMNLYLPIKVSETDELPLQCCWSCASTLLSWHDLIVASIEADRRLRSYQFITEKELITAIDYKSQEDTAEEQTKEMGPEPMTTSLNAFCQTETTSQNYEEDKKFRKPNRKKRKTDLVNYFQTSDPTNSLETYITNIQHNFITDDNELTTINNENDYKVPIPVGGELILSENEEDVDDDDNKNVDIKNLQEDFTYDENSDVDDEEEEQILSDIIKPDKDNNVQSFHFACQYCPTVYLLEKDVISHIQSDHPGNDYNVTQLTEPNTQQQQRHKKDKRKNTKIDQEVINAAKVIVDGRIYYNCKECGKSLHSPYTYIWHMRIHTGERPFVCDLCGKQFRVSQGLVRHLRETHEGIKNFPCDICGRMFATRRNVEEHRRIHTNERPYICDLCGKSFKQKASLFVHNRSHNNLFPFKCSYCNQSFRTKPPLLIHITRHTGEKPYKCDICGRCFRIKYELKRHRLIHSDEKPFSCTLCGLSFRQKRYLRNHNKSNHTLVTTT